MVQDVIALNHSTGAGGASIRSVRCVVAVCSRWRVYSIQLNICICDSYCQRAAAWRVEAWYLHGTNASAMVQARAGYQTF